MAESSAANRVNAQSVVTSETNPSIFEVLAQQSLADGLRRAASYLINILYTNNTEKFDFWYKNFDELYLLADICVQFCHLRAFNASFAEHFYSLKRISADKTRHRVLNGRQVLTSLALLTAFPYIKAKFDSLYARLKLRELESQTNSQTTDQLNRQRLFVRAYPTILTFCRLLSLYYEISYAVDRNPYHSPLLRLAGVRLINLEDNDLKAPTDQLMSAIEPSRDLFSRFARLSVTATKCLATGFAAGLSVSAFFIQFLDYWYSTDMYAHSFAPLPIPPAPPKIDIDIPVEKCPICLNVRQNDTALMTSGFVFCYACIVNHLKVNSRCPVTGYPTATDQLIKLYPPDA